MKITIYTDSDVTGSTHIMAVDLAREFEGLGHEVTIAINFKQVATSSPDLLLNFIPKDVIVIAKQAGRYFYCGKMVTVFTPGISIFNNAQLSYMLMSVVDGVPIVAHSPSIFDSLVTKTRRYFSPAIARVIMDGLHLIPYGVGGQYVFRKRTQEELGKYIAPFTRAVEDHKRFSVHQKITLQVQNLFKLKGLGAMSTAFYASSSKLSHIDERDMSGYEVKEIVLDRIAYARELQDYAFSISTSDYESFGLYYIELLLSGVIVLFADYPWVRKLLPSYRFVCSEKDLASMALQVRVNYDDCFKYLEEDVLPYLRSNYLLRIFAGRLLEKFKVETRNA
jgi:hypothetical protein